VFKFQRHEEILQHLESERTVGISSLASRLYVSEATIRRDLNALEKRGLVHRVFGGVVLTKFLNENLPQDIRVRENLHLKEIVAKRASRLLHDGASVILDGSTTVQMLIPHLSKLKNLLIITNNLEVISGMSSTKHKLICTGGQYLMRNKVFAGYQAEAMLRDFYADLLFFSSQGYSEEGEITDSSEEESALRRVMLSRAKTKVYMCDHTKLNKRYTYRICDKNGVDHVICDVDL